MSYILFLDESGHDHRTMPYEVRGGVILHASKLWPFVQGMRRLEMTSFGATLASVGSELKGHRLLDKNRFQVGPAGADDGRCGQAKARTLVPSEGAAETPADKGRVHGLRAGLPGHGAWHLPAPA
ncbi:hypothetical protein [Sorangium sp. So ce513]|uniref:hypothetical protein n=1 Tax=Sorangium sp. So ce513 TaxID=3133315 RepID=UPI003F617846